MKNTPLLVTAALVMAGLSFAPLRGLCFSLAAMGTLVALHAD